MCFSPIASFIASGVIGTIGVLTLRKVRSRLQIPLASIPLIFAFQQLIEGILWLSFNHPLLLSVMTYAYSFFSHVVWPAFIPLSVLLIEKNLFRKKILSGLLLGGAVLSAYLLYLLIAYPVTARIINGSIYYASYHQFSQLAITLYFVAVVVSCLFSSDRIINLFGLLAGASAFIAYLFYAATVFSVWCFFSAIVSMLIYWYFHNQEKNPRSSRTETC